MIKLDQIKMPIEYTSEDIIVKCAKILIISKNEISFCKILRKSIDARHKPNIFYVLSVGLKLINNLEEKFLQHKYEEQDYSLNFEKKKIKNRPIVVGFGPSGMFAALCFARMGLKPIVLEQGKPVEQREKDIENFWNNRVLNKFSNVQFGEGGAGTYSDGKLNTNVNNFECKQVLYELYSFGAPEEILYEAKPHIGSDKLKQIVVNIRKEILSLGGKILFSHKLTNLIIENGVLKKVVAKNVETQEEKIFVTNHLLLCVGHSARDVFKMLYSLNAKINQKPFAMGVRIEQRQEDINEMQYGKCYNKHLKAADYKLVCHLPNGRSVFTFCMCPGGEVVASSSDDGEIVTNGMSNFAREKDNCNSALLVNVTTEDFASSHPLAGVEFQAKWEKKTFELGGKNFNAPAQSVGEFLGRKTKEQISSTYKPQLTYTDISKCLPDFVASSLKDGIKMFNKKNPNFAKDSNLLIAIESRSSSPVTIVRDENFESNIKGIYPVGEGAGYAGGIVTSAQDGIKVAKKIYSML